MLPLLNLGSIVQLRSRLKNRLGGEQRSLRWGSVRRLQMTEGALKQTLCLLVYLSAHVLMLLKRTSKQPKALTSRSSLAEIQLAYACDGTCGRGLKRATSHRNVFTMGTLLRRGLKMAQIIEKRPFKVLTFGWILGGPSGTTLERTDILYIRTIYKRSLTIGSIPRSFP